MDEQHPIVIVIVWENEPALEHLRQMVARVEDWDVDRQAVLTKLKVTLMRSVRANTRVGRLVRRMRSLSASVVDGRDQCLDLNHDRRIWGMVSRVMVMPGDCEAHSH